MSSHSGQNALRRAAIVVSAILGLFAAVYLAGLLAQLAAGYQEWLAQDGYGGGVTMRAVDFSILACLRGAFSVGGLKALLFMAVIGGGIVVYIKLNNRFGKGEYDERNFKRAREGTYGTAAWMSDKEMRRVLEVTTPEQAYGTILGEKNGKVLCLPASSKLNKHIFVCGASGTMKSRAIVRNLLFQAVKRGESVVLTDPKAELYNDTAELFRQSGYEVKVFNLVSPEHSDSWNCMAGLAGDTLTTQILADVIIANTSKGKIDHFWDNGEGNLLKSLILYVDQDASRAADDKHLPAVYQMLTQNGEKQLSALFDRLPVTHPAKAPYSLFAQASDTVRAGIVLGLGTRLQILQNEAIRRVTSGSDIDLAEPGKTKCAYFVILSDQESSTEFLSSLFFSFLFIHLTRYADSTPELRCRVPVNIVFEELNNVGRLDSYPRRLSVARSRALQICHIVQSLAQFQNRYPDNEWSEIVGNCDTQIMLGVTEKEGAEFFSMRSGDSTVRVNSTMMVKQTIAIAQIIPQYRETDGLGRRRLLTPDEILRFPNDELLIILRGENVLRARKFDFTRHPFAKRLEPSSIFDYRSEATVDGRRGAGEGSGETPLYHTDFKDAPPIRAKRPRKPLRHTGTAVRASPRIGAREPLIPKIGTDEPPALHTGAGVALEPHASSEAQPAHHTGIETTIVPHADAEKRLAHHTGTAERLDERAATDTSGETAHIAELIEPAGKLFELSKPPEGF